MKISLIIAGIIIGLFLIAWLGLRIQPSSFASFAQQQFAQQSRELDKIQLPADLPAPVERFYRTLYGERLPIIETAVVSGRGRLRIKGITFPARFRFTHKTGEAYRHYIETTFYGLPLLKVNEHYLGGNARLELPFGISEGPKINQGANLALWAEAIWMPSVWTIDRNVFWEPIDANTALLVIPYGEEEDRFVVRFDPVTGLLSILESMRYKDENSDGKTLWLNRVVAWEKIEGRVMPAKTTITWFDEGDPWAVFRTEEVVYNIDVGDYIQQKGP
jgi:hypothetical protein